MRIALLTIWHEKNYGAELQAYATIKILQKMGHDVKMIDIRLADMQKISVKGCIAHSIMYFSPCNRKFNGFWEKNIPCTRRYKSIEELKADPPEADVYMVGSDQVWNPDITKDFSNLFFLNFGPEHVKKVSFASSFGVDVWTHDNLNSKIVPLLKRFSAISCREQSGVEILKNSFQINSTCVVDPTIILGDYSTLTGPIKPRKTLVFYPLSKDFELENFSKSLAKRLDLQAINNKNSTTLFNRIEWDRISIEDWIRNIAEAEFVITRSFHGVVFSLLYKRQFAALSSRNGRGARLEDLLARLGLSNRIYSNIIDIETLEPWKDKIDYTIISKKIDELRKESLNYLESILL